MAEYIIEFHKHIHSGFSAASSNDVWLRRRITLPFVPFVGLTIREGEFEETVTEIAWDVDRGEFRAYAESDRELYEAALGRMRSGGSMFGNGADEYAAALEIAKQYDGWEVCEPDWRKSLAGEAKP